jgi:hypothetical protein
MTEDYESIIKAADQIRDILLKAALGGVNEPVRQEIKKLTSSIRYKASDNYIHEKVTSIEVWVDVLFSVRKWEKYGDDPKHVQGFILGDCARIVNQAQRRQAQ